MNTVSQRPYLINRDYNQNKEAQREQTQEAQEERAQSQQRSRGLDYQASNPSNTPQASSPVPYNAMSPVRPVINPQYGYQNNIHYSGNYAQGNYGNYGNYGTNTVPQSYSSNIAPAESDANTMVGRSDKINIAQIIKDFKNTIVAIATPDELAEEVRSYVALVEKQVKRDNPSVKIVQTNLKNAGSLLDAYISETLNKDSKVVQNWLDAVFLQNINYAYNEDEINKDFLVKFPEDRTKGAEEVSENEVGVESVSEDVYEEQNQPEIKKVFVPEDVELKDLFINAKRSLQSNNQKAAMKLFAKALERAEVVNDKETASKICYEMGRIYDGNDCLVEALDSYHKSLQNTKDNNLRTRAHIAMAQIYDDVNLSETAISHYITSVSYAGQEDNLAAQSTSMTKIANIFAGKYNNEAFDYYNMALSLVEQVDNSKIKGYVTGNTAIAYDKFNKPEKALSYYSQAVQNYSTAESPMQTAIYYEKAAGVMIDYGNPHKARSLLQKALYNARQTDNTELIKSINEKLADVEFEIKSLG